jgi:hypothetical protein
MVGKMGKVNHSVGLILLCLGGGRLSRFLSPSSVPFMLAGPLKVFFR